MMKAVKSYLSTRTRPTATVRHFRGCDGFVCLEEFQNDLCQYNPIPLNLVCCRSLRRIQKTQFGLFGSYRRTHWAKKCEDHKVLILDRTSIHIRRARWPVRCCINPRHPLQFRRMLTCTSSLSGVSYLSQISRRGVGLLGFEHADDESSMAISATM
ncbi:hypothetical protein NEOLEDRAFT_302713 [Neolentinus lepideus HHB14362 ss-1]|uniref:Uncharacterized protein n=1 Tax=Neolentinus lepideus HHB14362 ss-1 TaxID=1314782 RepID=A0A165VQZ0_9AGAM|nr:hypothetical protein NEOLEDRAFT_302713 [Neolentinus lepideus HHB14362 ss-1]